MKTTHGRPPSPVATPADHPAEDGIDVVRRARAIRCVALDVDGTLTDGGIVIGPEGEVVKRFSVRDGFGLRLLREAGIAVAIITGRRSTIVQARAAELGITDVMQGVADKVDAGRALCERHGLALHELALVGDDWPDLALMRACGLGAAPADADPVVLRHAQWVSRHAGGHGAVREFAEFVLHAQGRLDALRSRYLGDGAPR